MSKIVLAGYVIDVDNLMIDFSATPNFDPSRLDYIQNPETGTYYYVRPRPQTE